MSPSRSLPSLAPEAAARRPPRLQAVFLLPLLLLAAGGVRGVGPAEAAEQPDLAVTAEDIVLPRPSLLEGMPATVAVRVTDMLGEEVLVIKNS